MKKFFFTLLLGLLCVSATAMQQKGNIRQADKIQVLASVPSVDADDMPDVETYAQMSSMMKMGKKAAISSISDLYGTWMMSYSDWDGGTGYTSEYCTLSIKKGLTSSQVIISGWWLGVAKDITATVNWSAQTITIARQRLIEIDGYTSADLVNFSDTTATITGKIYSGGIQFLGVKWGVKLVGTDSYYAVGTNSMLKKCNGKMSYTFDGQTYTDDVLMGQNGTTVANLSIYNFGGWGTMMNIDMHGDSTFSIEPTILYTDESGDNYYCYGTDGNTRWKITGTGTEYRLTFDTSWSLCSPTTESWMGEISNTVIYFTDGTLFRYPPVAPTGISLNITDADEQVLEPGESLQLEATITPANANQAVTWTSSDETVATVDATGLVTALMPSAQGAPSKAPRLEDGGKVVTITATSVADNSLSASVRLYVGYPASGGLFGDLNNDGYVDVADVNILINVILGNYHP